VNEVCVCPAGWTGIGDFVFGAPSCNINIIAITVLYAVLLALHVGGALYTIRYIKIKFEVANPQQRQGCLPPGVLLGILVLFFDLTMAAVAALRISAPGTRVIGTDPACTVLFSVGCCTFYATGFQHITDFLNINMAHLREKTKIAVTLKTLLQRLLPVYMTMASISTLGAVLAMLGATSANMMQAFASWHYLGCTAVFSFFGWYMVPTLLKPLTQEVRNSIALMDKLATSNTTAQRGELSAVLTRLERFLKESRNQVFGNFVLCILFGAWPLLTSLSSYFLPISWMSAGAVTSIAVRLGMPSELARQRARQTSTTGNSPLMKNTNNNNTIDPPV